MDINLTNVSFSYPEEPNKTVINIPSWSLSRGEHTFIYGPSGVGKSTLLGLLSGVLRAQQGDITIFGHNLTSMSNHQRDKFRANTIGYVFQTFNLIPYLDAFDNIRLANYFSDSTSNASLEQAITELLNNLNIPNVDRKKPVSRLSIGQQQRIAIARALINKPKLLIVDEPTSSLDKDNCDLFMKLLMSVVQDNNITLLFVSHDMSLAPYFKHVESLQDINLMEHKS